MKELIFYLEKKIYNVFFYVGYGILGLDGGWLFLVFEIIFNGIELV